MTATRTLTDTTVEVSACSVDEWRERAVAFLDSNVYQTCAYAERRAEEMNGESERVLVRRRGDVVGMAHVRIKRLPMMRAGVAYLYRGPLWRRELAGADDLRVVVAALREEFGARRGLEVRLVPNMTDAADHADQVKALRSAGFVRRQERPVERTIYLDLSPDLDALRQGLAQKWRNGLNQSERRNVTVEARTDDAAMGAFETLYDEMWAGKRFETRVSVSSFRRVQAALPADQKLTVRLAYYDGDVIAGHVASCLGDTCLYMLGASNEEGRRRKASYLLQWKTIEAAKAAAARWYDLGGIDPKANPGVYRFKAGLGGRECCFLGEYVATARGSGKVLVPLAEKVYRLLGSRCRRGQG